MNRVFRALQLLPLVAAIPASAETLAFLVCGDPQYLAEHRPQPRKLDPLSEIANTRFIERVNHLPGTVLPEKVGGGSVSTNLHGLIVTGDLVDSLDKQGGPYPAMARFEWQRFLKDYGLNGKDGRTGLPVYELHGNHDGPQADTFVVEAIIERNKTRPAVVNLSTNGLHYSWDWGPLHLINLGMFAGSGEWKREGHHYAARASLEFLRDDLETQVGASGRPVIVSHHLQLNAPEFDWPDEDRAVYYELLSEYNVIAIFNGHTHGSPPRHNRWNGKQLSPRITGIDNYDPDDAGASKLHKGKPVGLAHGLLYVELIDQPGVEQDRFRVRSLKTRDNWETSEWDRLWEKAIRVPD